MTDCDVVILGAGPYGLSAGNRLRHIKGLDVRVFGEPMSFWESSMPAGMFLRSNWPATQIADHHQGLTLECFRAECGNHLAAPIPVERFIEYGKWYQRKSLPDLDHRKISLIESHSGGFRSTLEDGERLTSRRVVVAAGINAFAYRPPEFDGFPASLVSHTSNHADFRKFAGKKVLVIGSGQSALESAALLHLSGACAELVSRSSQIHWLQGWASRVLHSGLGKVTNRMLYAPTDVGPAGVSQLMARPDLLRRLPRAWQDKLRQRSIRPAGARWLVDRLQNVPIRLDCPVSSISLTGERVRVRFQDGTERIVDHVILGTGYHIDIRKYAFLDPGLLSSLQILNGFPVLRQGLESSVPGLHFLGAPGAWSLGPLVQFVSGTHYTTRALAHHLERPVRPGRASR